MPDAASFEPLVYLTHNIRLPRIPPSWTVRVSQSYAATILYGMRAAARTCREAAWREAICASCATAARSAKAAAAR